MKALEYSHNSLPTFHNLIKLELDVYHNGGRLLPDLLESSPNLEVLVFLGVSRNANNYFGYSAVN